MHSTKKICRMKKLLRRSLDLSLLFYFIKRTYPRKNKCEPVFLSFSYCKEYSRRIVLTSVGELPHQGLATSNNGFQNTRWKKATSIAANKLAGGCDNFSLIHPYLILCF